MGRMLFCFITCFLCTQIYGIDIRCLGGNSKDISAALSRAVNGDRILVPSGRYIIDRTIRLKGGVTVTGAGKDSTVLIMKGKAFAGFIADGRDRLPVRITSMTIKGSVHEKSTAIKLINGCRNFRVDSISFIECLNQAVEVYGNATGVIDHNVFINNEVYGVVVYGNGDSSWCQPLELGTEHAVFIEDNYFGYDGTGYRKGHHVASNNGSRYVFRYNTINDGNLESHCIDAHGKKYYWPRGSRSYEIYSNSVIVGNRWLGINIRGGDGVIFNNKFTGHFSGWPIHLMYEGKDADTACTYPCPDQIRSIYIWNNTVNGTAAKVFIRHENLIRNNRDYFLCKMPGYTPFPYPHPLTRQH